MLDVAMVEPNVVTARGGEVRRMTELYPSVMGCQSPTDRENPKEGGWRPPRHKFCRPERLHMKSW